MPRQAAERALRTLCDRDSHGKWGKDNTEEEVASQSTGEKPSLSSLPTHTQLCFSLPTPNLFSGLAFQKAIQRAMLFVLHELRDGNLTERFAILCRVAGGFSLLNG